MTALIDLIAEIRDELREQRTILSSLVEQGQRQDRRTDELFRLLSPSRVSDETKANRRRAETLLEGMKDARRADPNFPRSAQGHVGKLRRAVVLAGMSALIKGAEGPAWLIAMINSGRVRSEPEAMAYEFPELFADAQAAEDALTNLANDLQTWSLW